MAYVSIEDNLIENKYITTTTPYTFVCSQQGIMYTQKMTVGLDPQFECNIDVKSISISYSDATGSIIKIYSTSFTSHLGEIDNDLTVTKPNTATLTYTPTGEVIGYVYLNYSEDWYDEAQTIAAKPTNLNFSTSFCKVLTDVGAKQVWTNIKTLYNSKFDTMTTYINDRCNAIETELATLKTLTKTNYYFNMTGDTLVFNTNERYISIPDTNLKPTDIVIKHDTTVAENTIYNGSYGNGYSPTAKDYYLWFRVARSGNGPGLEFCYKYLNGSSGCAAIRLNLAMTGDLIGYIYINISSTDARITPDILFSKTIYS
jgi:hypothetical protein